MLAQCLENYLFVRLMEKPSGRFIEEKRSVSEV